MSAAVLPERNTRHSILCAAYYILAARRYHHQIFYEYLVYRRPDKLVNLGNGVTWLNIPVMA